MLKFIVVKISTYDSKHGFKEWFEIQPQYDNSKTIINMEHINNE